MPSDAASRWPGSAVLGSTCEPRNCSRAASPRVSSPGRVPSTGVTTSSRLPRTIDGRSSGTNGPASTCLLPWATDARTASAPAANSGTFCPSAAHASSVSGLGASVRGTSVSPSSWMAWRPSRPVGLKSASVSGLMGMLATYAGSACNGHTHATFSGSPTVERAVGADRRDDHVGHEVCEGLVVGASEIHLEGVHAVVTQRAAGICEHALPGGGIDGECVERELLAGTRRRQVVTADAVVERGARLQRIVRGHRDLCARGHPSGVEAHGEVGAGRDPRALLGERERRRRTLRAGRTGPDRGDGERARHHECGQEQGRSASEAGRHNERPRTHRPAGRISNPNDW